MIFQLKKMININQYHSLLDFIDQQCVTYHHSIAFENFGTQMTFKELHDRSVIFAAYLQCDLKLKKGDRFGIMLPNILQFPIALCGALRAGLIIVNINPFYTIEELSHQLNDAGVTAMIILENVASTLEKALPLISVQHVIVTSMGDCLSGMKGFLLDAYLKYIRRQIPDWHIPHAILYDAIFNTVPQKFFSPVAIDSKDIAFLQYTGGTTGTPKGAMLSHGNIVANIIQSLEAIKTKLSMGCDTVIMALPLYHIFSLTGCLFFMAAGAKSLLITDPRDMRLFVKILRSHRFEIFMGLNTLFNGLMRQEDFKKINFSSLRLVISGGMALQQAVADRWQALTHTVIIEGYGLTETSPVVAINPVNSTLSFSGSVGLPAPLTEVSIRDSADQAVAVGEAGELWVRGPQVMQGYWHQPAETKAVLNAEGWLRTGDLARIDEKGMIYIVGRQKDMIIVSGFNVYPVEIESVLMLHPSVKEAAVVGTPSEKTGEAVTAFIVLQAEGPTAQDIIDFCKQHLTKYKIPTKIIFCTELPKSSVGKVLHRKLR